MTNMLHNTSGRVILPVRAISNNNSGYTTDNYQILPYNRKIYFFKSDSLNMWWRKNPIAILFRNTNRHCGKVGNVMKCYHRNTQDIVFWVQNQVKSLYEIIQKLPQGFPEFTTVSIPVQIFTLNNEIYFSWI